MNSDPQDHSASIPSAYQPTVEDLQLEADIAKAHNLIDWFLDAGYRLKALEAYDLILRLKASRSPEYAEWLRQQDGGDQ